MAATKFPCSSCGADLVFQPGTTHLACPYCGKANDIAVAPEPVEELDFESALTQLDENSEHIEAIQTECKSCRATVQMEPNAASQNCPFCGSHLVATGISTKLIKPRSLLPFGIDKRKAQGLFRTWLTSRWFAPSALKKLATLEGDTVYKGEGVSGLAGLYMPYWTYDCRVQTPYTGERGDDYYVSVPRTVYVNGKAETRMVQERRTRWSSVSGSVPNRFDDVLVIASDAIPVSQLSKLGQWDLKNLVPYSDEFLSGFRTQTYTVTLPQGFGVAQVMMDPVIRENICSDIGGDHQRITSMDPQYSNITFKHILLPVWVSAYRYEGKVYRFLVNARTGEITGDRPYSVAKIALTVIAVIAAVAVIALISSAKH
jgi:hypothetical protein